MQPEPGWGLPSVRAWSAACVGPPAFPVGAFRAKGRRCQRMRHRRHCPVQRGLQTSRSPHPPAASQQLRVGSWPPIPPGDAVQHPWVLQCWRGPGTQRHRAPLITLMVPPYTPSWLPAHLGGLQFLHGGLLCHMGHGGLWHHPVNPAHHPAGCGQCRGVSSWQEPCSRGAHCPGNTSCTSCSHCLLSSPERSLVSFCFHVLLGKHSTAAQPEQAQLSSSSLTAVVGKLDVLFYSHHGR